MTSPQDLVLLGRPGGQTTFPEWITLAGASPQAQTVYKILRMHLDTFVGSGEDPFPAQELIAAIMKCSQSAVSRYIKELVDLGAVETTRRKVPGGGLQYRLHQTPPPGYTGPTTLAEFIPSYLAAKADANGEAKGEANVESTNGTDAPAANAPIVAPSRPAKAKANGAATNGTTVARTNGQPLPTVNGATPTVEADANDDTLGRLLSAADDLGMFDDDVSVRPKMTSRLRSMITDGWVERELHKLVTENLGGADNRGYVALRHLRDAQDRQVRVAKRQAEQPPAGPMCTKGGAHARYRANNCTECRIEEVELARQAAPKSSVVYGTAFSGSRR
jgi:hypothetical protein